VINKISHNKISDPSLLRVPQNYENMFISGGNPHLTNRFCEVVLGPKTVSIMVSEPLQDLLGHLLSGFRYRATNYLCPRTKPNSAGHEGVC